MVDYTFLDDYFDELIENQSLFKATHPDNELMEDDFEHIWGEEIANAVEQGFGISTFDYIKKVIQESLNGNDFETVSKISKQLVGEAEWAEEDNPANISYWEFYENGCELNAITRRDISRYFLEYLTKKK